MEAAAVAGGRLYHVRDLGWGTSGEAEWLALLHALDIAEALGADDVILVGDAANVVQQARGRTRCATAEAKAFRARYALRAAAFARVRIRHVRRGQNLAGIELDRLNEGGA